MIHKERTINSEPFHTRVLVVDDEAAIRKMIAFTLRDEGYEVREAGDVKDANREITEHRPDVVLLDWMLPGESGIDYARRLRNDALTEDLPIIMLTARGEERDKLQGFDVGCDDYVAKPFSIKELTARIRAVMKRVRGFADHETLRHDGLALYPHQHRVTANRNTDGTHLGEEQDIKIGPTEFRLLRFFMANAERVYTRSQLLDRVWGANVYVEDRTVDVHIRRLRKLLAPYGFERFIRTVHGTGYRFSSKDI